MALPESESQRKTPKATQDQLDSRKELSDFIRRVSKPAADFFRGIKSDWFGRPDSELKAWVERGHWLDEVKDSRWHQNEVATIEQEIKWAQEQLEIGKFEAVEVRMYLRALRFIKGYIVTTERNADIASRVLANRAGEIPKVTFINGGLNDRSGNY